MKRRSSLFLCALLVLVLVSGCRSGGGLTPATGSTELPPLIPHAVDAAAGGTDCLACHRTGSNGAPKNPDWHATLTDCGQCHVPQGAEIIPFVPSY